MEPPPPPPPPELVSDVLEQIFLLLASPADLVRASAACVSFHDIITSASFLRRYRSVHPPPLLGFINGDGFHPVDVEAAHPCAPIIARSVDFSFLPQITLVHDVRDGRVLVGRKYGRLENREQRRRRRGRRSRRRLLEYWDIGVCDPLFRRYLPLPPLTDDLLASVGLSNQDNCYSGASLIPASGGGMEEETSFRVICWMYSKARFAVFIFSTAATRSSASWAAVKSVSWGDLGLSEEADHGPCISGQYAHGCFYWKVYYGNELIRLDMDTMEFSKHDLPPDHGERSSIAIVESGEGGREVVMFSTLGEVSVECYTFTQSGAGDESYKWHLKSTIPLPAHGPYNNFVITGEAEGYVFLENILEEQDTKYLEYFSLEVKSCNIERACRINSRNISWPYFGFPKSMSQRRIQGHGEVPKF